MINFNFHQHSKFSDGKAAPEEYVKQAISMGFDAIGFSEHSPLPFDTPFSLKVDNINNYVSEIDFLKEKYSDSIKIYRSLELDYIPKYSEDFDKWKAACKTDYSIGGVHLVLPEDGDADNIWFTDGPDRNIYDKGIWDFFGGDIKKAVKTYFRQINAMIDTQNFDVIAHFDKIKMHNQNRFFSEDDRWYMDLISETLTLIKENNIIVEVNTRGLYKKRYNGLFPDGNTLKQTISMGIPVIISSDAHKPEEINLEFDYAIKKLQHYRCDKVMFFNGNYWEERGLR